MSESAGQTPHSVAHPRAEPRRREYGLLVGYDVTGFSAPFVGVQWTKTARDKDFARAVVVFLEDRRVLFAHRHVGERDRRSGDAVREQRRGHPLGGVIPTRIWGIVTGQGTLSRSGTGSATGTPQHPLAHRLDPNSRTNHATGAHRSRF